MRQSEAVDILNHLMVTVQKLRSNEREAIEHFPGSRETKARVLASLQPWVHGDKCLLPSLEKVLAPGHDLTPMEFFNFMYVVDKWVPEIGVMTAIREEEDFPEPSISWIRGWD